MKSLNTGETIEVPVFVISNEQNEIMINEDKDGSFIITQTYEGDEVVVAYILPRNRIKENINKYVQ